MAPTRPPTATELINNSVVQAAMDQAWADSQPNDPANRYEEGGWIYMDTATGQISTARAAAGSKRQISLAGPSDGRRVNSCRHVPHASESNRRRLEPAPERNGQTFGRLFRRPLVDPL
jgi:hypothetical protein